MGGAERVSAVQQPACQALRCPACRLVIRPRVLALTPRHCPRCLARRRVAVKFETLLTPEMSDGAVDSSLRSELGT